MNSYPQGSNQQKSEDNSGLFTALAGIGLTGLGIIGGRRLGHRYRTEPVNVKVDPGATADVRRASTVDIPKIPSEVKRQQEIQEFYQKARQPSRGGAVVTDLSQQNPQVATNTGQDLTKAAQTEAANQFLAQGKERTGVSYLLLLLLFLPLLLLLLFIIIIILFNVCRLHCSQFIIIPKLKTPSPSHPRSLDCTISPNFSEFSALGHHQGD